MSAGKLLVDTREAASLLDVSERRFQQLRKDPGFPRPVELGPRTIRWRTTDLATYVGSLSTATTRHEPAQLRRGRLAIQESAAA